MHGPLRDARRSGSGPGRGRFRLPPTPLGVRSWKVPRHPPDDGQGLGPTGNLAGDDGQGPQARRTGGSASRWAAILATLVAAATAAVIIFSLLRHAVP